jgi:hypothetical protein
VQVAVDVLDELLERCLPAGWDKHVIWDLDIIFAKAAIVGGVRAIPNAAQELGEFTLFALERDLLVVGQVRLSAAGQAHICSESPRLHTLPDVTSLERRMHDLTLRTLWDDGQNLLEVATEDHILAAEEVRVLND